MKVESYGDIILSDFEPRPQRFENELLAGLKRQPKMLPCKFFYDELGSQLFDRICELDEYYLTRTETRILRENIAEIAGHCGSRAVLVEFGSGSSSKTRLLLDHLESPSAYVPIDISRSQLLRTASRLNGDYFPLEILPVCADYNQPLALPTPSGSPQSRVIFFPGSTIGNFDPDAAVVFLRQIAGWCQAGDGLLIGVDLQKPREVLERAYNDAPGITAEFNLNLLNRANRELGAHFNLEHFHHHAFYNGNRNRIEMHLVSDRRQTATIAGKKIGFAKDEHVITEYSYKYRVETFSELVSRAGWRREGSWTDPRSWFSVQFFRRSGECPG